MSFKKLFTKLILLAFIANLHGCASRPEDDDPTLKLNAAQLYEEAKYQLTEQNWSDAITLYEKLESRYPYGPYAQQAQLEVAYAYYKYDEIESAILAADRFIKLNPQHPNVDYAYYLKGLVRYDTDLNIFERWFNVDISERDPGNARKAFDYFSELVNKFPLSRYRDDAIKRMYQLRNNLAKNEIHIANYYIKRGAYLSAVNRAKFVVENYQQTPSVPDALAIMVDAYRELGLNKLADDALRVLELNHPQHTSLQASKG